VNAPQTSPRTDPQISSRTSSLITVPGLVPGEAGREAVGERADGAVPGWWGRALLARVPVMVWPFVLLSVLLVVVVVVLTRWWLLPVVAVAAVAAAVVEWANSRGRGPLAGWTGQDAVAVAVQLLVLVGGVSFVVLVVLGLAGVGVPSWAVVR
jgi:hypothetical protein